MPFAREASGRPDGSAEAKPNSRGRDTQRAWQNIPTFMAGHLTELTEPPKLRETRVELPDVSTIECLHSISQIFLQDLNRKAEAVGIVVTSWGL